MATQRVAGENSAVAAVALMAVCMALAEANGVYQVAQQAEFLVAVMKEATESEAPPESAAVAAVEEAA